MAVPDSPTLSASQLATLAELGEERTAGVGDVLYRVGDQRYPFIAILEGEVAILDAAGNEIVRHGPSGFLGELNLLSGQTVFVTAVVTEPLRYIAVDRDVLRALLFEDGPLERPRALDVHRAARGAAAGRGPRHRDRRPALVRGDDADARLRAQQPPAVHVARPDDGDPRAAPDGRPRRGCPAARSCARPSTGQVSRALGIGRELAPARRSTCSSSAAVRRVSARRSTAPPRASTRWSSRAPRSAGRPARRAGSRTTSASRPGITGTELTSRAVTQARKFGARLGDALPRGRRSSRATDATSCGWRRTTRSPRAPCCSRPAREYRRLPVDDLAEYEGLSVFYAAGPPEAQLCGASRVGVVGGGNSAGQAAVWLARGGALVTLLHRRADLRETMSDYLVRELERYGVAVRDRSEIAALHGADGQLEAVTLTSGERLPFSFLFLFLGALPCTEWLGDAVARDENGFILTGAARDAERSARDQRPGHVRGRRRPLGLDQALRDRRGRGRHGRAVRPRAPRGRRQRSELKLARISVVNSSGSSQAAKWPPLSTLLK